MESVAGYEDPLYISGVSLKDDKHLISRLRQYRVCLSNGSIDTSAGLGDASHVDTPRSFLRGTILLEVRPILGDLLAFRSTNESVKRLSSSSVDVSIDIEIDRLFYSAKEEKFEIGMDSQFANSLQELSECGVGKLVKCLENKLMQHSTEPKIAVEVMEWASRQEGYNDVVRLLAWGLNHESAVVRDNAALSLAYFDEKIASKEIGEAIEREQIPELREDMEDLVRSLES